MLKIRKVFDKSNPNWDENPEFNKMFLTGEQTISNDVFQAQGCIFLKDIYGFLGFAITKEACTHGWVKGKTEGDYVRFTFEQIEGTNDFEIIFECYPILTYIQKEDEVEVVK